MKQRSFLIFYIAICITILGTFWYSTSDAKETTGPLYFIAGSNTSLPFENIENIQTIDILEGTIRLSLNKGAEHCVNNEQYFIEINGAITAELTVATAGILSQMQGCIDKTEGIWPTPVYLNSTGGSLMQGFLMGRLFDQHLVIAIVTGGQHCTSACTVAFLGAQQRTIEHNGILQFHAPYRLEKEDDKTTFYCGDPDVETAMRNYYNEQLPAESAAALYDRTFEICDPNNTWDADRKTALEYNLLTE